MKFIVAALSLLMLAGFASAGIVGGFSDITVAGDGSNLAINTVTFNGYEYGAEQLIFGETTRWWYHKTHRRPDMLWLEGDPEPDFTPYDKWPIDNTSNPKVGDVGSHADTVDWRVDGENWISSLDAINYQETIFAEPVTDIFVFERGGNDNGTIQAINLDDSLGPELALVKNGAPYEATGVSVGGQGAFGYLYQSEEPIKGLRISASGHDTLSIFTTPEPGTLSLIGLAGLILLARRRR